MTKVDVELSRAVVMVCAGPGSAAGGRHRDRVRAVFAVHADRLLHAIDALYAEVHGLPRVAPLDLSAGAFLLLVHNGTVTAQTLAGGAQLAAGAWCGR